MADSRVATAAKSKDAATKHEAPSSLFAEMFDWMLAPFLLVWPLSIGVTYAIGISISNEAFDRSLASKTRALAEQVAWVEGREGAAANIELRADLRTMLADDDADSYLYRIDRADVSDSKNSVFQLGEPELPPFASNQLRDDGLVSFQTVDFRDSTVRIAAVKRSPGVANDAAKTFMVYVAESTEKRRALAYDIMKGIVVPQLVVVPLMIFLMWTGLKRGAAPLARLRERVVARDANDLRPLTASDAPSEVAPLINSFNDLLQRVESEGAAQKRFIANAAHQLRTPLAGIRMQTELALRSDSVAERDDALHKIALGTSRTAHLINQLLMLARTEGSAVDSLPFAPLDFSAVAREVVADAYPRASEKAIEIAFDAPDTAVIIHGHADLLRELVSNLVDNAIRYTPARGHINVRVTTAPSATLEVEDDGIGIPIAEREQVFERFYRVLGSTESGSGIGLAIVKEIAIRHGATVSIATPASGAGSLFCVQFAATAEG
jgi:two-component system, OmpR family, sensor histidine kinase TctE